MALAIPDFWKLTADSRLFSPQEVAHWTEAFSKLKGASKQGNALTLSEWLIAEKAISRYQATILMAGRPGPFVYGEYKVTDRIAAGRLAGLFRAVHAPTGQEVCLYFLTGAATQNPQAVAQAQRQVHAARAVMNPCASRCFELVDLGSFKFVAIEALSGETVEDRLAARGPFAPADACRIIRHAATGLAKLHDAGQVHGDVRASNVWLDAAGNGKLLQLPLSRDPFTAVGQLDFAALETAGRIEAMADNLSPELAQAGQPPSPVSDIYALGCTLYQLIAGRPPFAGGDWRQKLMRHASEPIQPLTQFGAPPQLAQVVSYLMAKDPSVRYQQAGQVAEAMAYFVEPNGLALPADERAPTMKAYEALLAKRSPLPSPHAANGNAPQGGVRPVSLQQPAAQPAQNFAAAPPVTHAPPSIEPPRYSPAVEKAPFDFGSYGSPTPNETAAFAPTGYAPAPSGYGAPAAGYAPAAVGYAPAPTGYSTVAPVANPYAPAVPAFAPASAAANPLAFGQYAAAPSPAGLPYSAPRPVGSSQGNTKLLIGAVLLAVVAVGGLLVWNANRNGGPPTNVATQTPGTDTKKPPNAGDKGTPPNPGSGDRPEGSDKNKTPSGSSGSSGSDDDKTKPPPPPPAVASEIDDDGQTLFQSPTNGKRLEIRYLATLPNVLAVFRPADLLTHPEGEKVWAALGPAGQWMRSQMESISGVKMNDVNQLTVALYDNPDGPFGTSFVLRMNMKLEGAEFLKTLGNPTQASYHEHVYFEGPTWSYYFPAKEDKTVLVIADSARMKEIIDAGSNAPTGNRKMERMLVDSDSLRQFNLFFIPDFLFADGRKSVFSGPLAPLEKPLEEFLGQGAKAGLLSVNLRSTFFIELRLSSAGGDPAGVAREFKEYLGKLPEQVETYLASMTVHPYARKLLMRFPEVLRKVDEFTRAGVDNDQGVLRCQLPAGAGQHLFMSAELALAQKPGQTFNLPTNPGGGSSTGSGTPPADSVAGKLKKVTTIMFPRDNLENTMKMIADESGVPVEILGGDLQLEGITKNQSFGLEEKDKPVGDILVKIMKLANPDGKLVYVIKPKATGGPDMIFITTRAAAAKRGDKLPPELQAEPPKK